MAAAEVSTPFSESVVVGPPTRCKDIGNATGSLVDTLSMWAAIAAPKVSCAAVYDTLPYRLCCSVGSSAKSYSWNSSSHAWNKLTTPFEAKLLPLTRSRTTNFVAPRTYMNNKK